METHKIKCDKCKKEINLSVVNRNYYYEYPKSWHSAYLGTKSVDLCPDCSKKYEEYKDSFIKKDVK